MAPIPHIPNIDTPPVARTGPPRQRRPRGGPGQTLGRHAPPPADAGGVDTDVVGTNAVDTNAVDTDALPGAAGPGYLGELGAFLRLHHRPADQPALPTTVPALTGFLAALPARPATVARRIRAIAAAHRRAGYLLTRPEHGPAAPRTHVHAAAAPRRGDPAPMIAACATRGWPAGLTGRRDAFLIVLTEVLGYPHRAARALSPADITEPSAGPTGESVPCLAGRPVPGGGGDPRSCPACALVRWLDILGVADGLGRGSARTALTAADAPTPASPHLHTSTGRARWRAAAVLLPAIDRHGWLDDYRPISTRTIRARLALVAGRAGTTISSPNRPTPRPRPRRPQQPLPRGPLPNWTRC